MLTACWSAKGGAGTTVVTCALALLAARASASGTLLVDLAGDAPASLGLPDPDGPGIVDWLEAGDDVPLDALERLEQPIHPGLALLPRGRGELRNEHAERGAVLAALLGADGRDVVVDCGIATDGAPLALASAADRSVLVTRPCFLALRRAIAAPIRPSEVVVIREPWRALDGRDVASTLGVPIAASIDLDPSIARAVDAGLLMSRLPRSLERDLGHAA